jgi:hypothetical protein
VKSVIRETDSREARALVEKLLVLPTGGEIGAEAKRSFAERYRDLSELAEA